MEDLDLIGEETVWFEPRQVSINLLSPAQKKEAEALKMIELTQGLNKILVEKGITSRHFPSKGE